MDLSNTSSDFSELSQAKACVQAHYADLARATPEDVADALAARMAPDALWRGMRPLHEQPGPRAVAEAVCAHFPRAPNHVQPREAILSAAANPGASRSWTGPDGHPSLPPASPCRHLRAQHAPS